MLHSLLITFENVLPLKTFINRCLMLETALACKYPFLLKIKLKDIFQQPFLYNFDR